jgi:hypothetical protein
MRNGYMGLDVYARPGALLFLVEKGYADKKLTLGGE